MFENLDSYFPKELTRMEYDKYLNRKSEPFSKMEKELFDRLNKSRYSHRIEYVFTDSSVFSTYKAKIILRKKKRTLDNKQYHYYKFYITKLEDEYFLI